ncbi:double-strand break repair protein AddB [Sphingorhabdus sp. EL138]|uniref:double-strand break repair protein AddB n=1 Tax=Sphingorhabdus sp. EL138 TaxID=2073156 RepID=UPI0025DB09E4|nr:double-strand break repair protein AddB [Sphingorhabdus sp. EL138]
MADKGSPPRAHVFNVPLGNDLCDVTVQWILQSAGADPLAICNSIFLLPNNRAIKAMTEAFVRQAAPGMLLPHMVAVGDMQLDEALGPMLDPIAASGAIWPAIASFERLMLLAKLVKDYQPADAPLSSAEALRLARKLAELIDALEVDLVDFTQFADIKIEADLAGHWQNAYARLLQILPAYRAALTARKLMGPAERRNHLLAALEQRLAQNVDTGPVIAVGITTSAKAVARVLRRVVRMPNGHVILPGVDLNLSDARWDDLSPPTEDSPGFARRRNVEVHPQFHLKHLLELMGIDRSEIDVLPTARTEPESATISEIFCLPEQSIHWQDLPPLRKSLPNAKWLEAEDSAQEAKAIAVHIRGALEVAGKRVALITPDRELAVRVAGQLHRWGIEVDDSAGIPLLQTPPGTLALALVDAIWSRFSASSILAIAKHPLVFAGTQRLAWLDHVRQLDLALRGTASSIGLSAITRRLETARKPNADLIAWWSGVATQLAPLEMADGQPFGDVLASLRDVATALTDGGIWRGASGRELTRNWEDVTSSDLSTLGRVDATGLVATFREIFSGAVVRPPYGGHPRVAIYGLLEARLQQADYVICAGLNEGTWPQIAQPDPWLAPAIRRHLKLPTLDRNIGLSAHDLATALGAQEVLLTRARRDRSGPTVASRFLLRIKALIGEALAGDDALLAWADSLDHPAEKEPFAARPVPMPNAEQRLVSLSVTDFDQLKSDPYSFYAKRILGLPVLEKVDAEPSYAWRGSLVHDILEKWFTHDNCAVDKLVARADALLAQEAADPLLRTFWQPRIAAGLRWVADETKRLMAEEGRVVAVAEQPGTVHIKGIAVRGRVDRIDRTADGDLVIIDYKTGMPPSTKQINAGFALQLGLIGYMAEALAIKGVSGTASHFEYWSLAKKKDIFGHIAEPTSTRAADDKPERADFVAFAVAQAEVAISKWILGNTPFTAKLHPEFAIYGDYDQLMRLQEWNGRQAIIEDAA